MRAKAQLNTPLDTPVSITLYGTLGEFKQLSAALLQHNVPYHQIRALLDQISEVGRKLCDAVCAEAPSEPVEPAEGERG